MTEDEFAAAAWLAARGKGGGFDDADTARRVLDQSEAAGRQPARKPSQAIISVSLDELDGTDGDLLS